MENRRITDMVACEFLDKLDSNNCWVSGLDGRQSHMDSYMTVPNYQNIEDVLKRERDNYTLTQWKEIIDYSKHFSYLSPNSFILARMIERFIFPETVK
jgi:deoxycytidine triphosphate deaminase